MMATKYQETHTGYLETDQGSYIETVDPYAYQDNERGGFYADIEIVTYANGSFVGQAAMNQASFVIEDIATDPKKWRDTIGGTVARITGAVDVERFYDGADLVTFRGFTAQSDDIGEEVTKHWKRTLNK